MACNSKITGERISELRKKKGLKQSELAQRLSVSRQIISYYETGARMPNTEDIVLLAEFFNTTTDYLLGVSDVSSTNIDLKAVCDYTGLSEEAVKILHGAYEDSVIYSSFYDGAIDFINTIIEYPEPLIDTYEYLKSAIDFMDFCQAARKDVDSYDLTVTNQKTKALEEMFNETKYYYFYAIESYRNFINNQIISFENCAKEYDNRLFSFAMHSSVLSMKFVEGEPNGNDNEEE